MIEQRPPPPHTRGVAGRKRPPGNPTDPHPLMVTGLTNDTVARLDAIVARLNADAQPGFSISRNAFVVATIEAAITAREKGGA